MNIYGILIGIGIILGIEILKRRTRIFSNIDILILLISALIGARLLFLLHNISEIVSKEINILNIWDGGLAFYGALLGILVSTYLISQYKKTNYLVLLDNILLLLPLIHSIGRIGNYFNYEIYGKPTSLPWGIYIPIKYRLESVIQYSHFHPVFIYESFLNLCTFLLLLALNKRFKIQGMTTSIYLISYSVIRLLLNRIRIDREYFYFFETSDLFSLIFLLIGIYIFLKLNVFSKLKF